MELRFRSVRGLWVAVALFAVLGVTGPAFAKSESFVQLTRERIEVVRGEVVPKLRTKMGTFGKKDLDEYESALKKFASVLPDTTANEPATVDETFDRVVEAVEAYHDVEARLRGRQLSTTESLQDLIDRGRDGPDEISNTRLLDEWFGRVGKITLDDRLLEVNRDVLTLGVVYSAYALRSDRRYRTDLLMRYLDYLFPSVTAGFLRDRTNPDLTRELYRRVLNLAYGEVRSLDENESVTRNFTNLLRDQGRVLREVARGGRGSSLLTKTLEDIDRIGRRLSGVVDDDSRFPFLD